MYSRRPAFSMIELVVVLGLIAFVLALLLPVIGTVRRAAHHSHGMNNLRQITIGIHAYHDTYRSFPPLVGKAQGVEGTLHFYLLPYLEQDHIYRLAKDDLSKAQNTVVPIFVDPLDRSAPPGNVYKEWLATTSYAGNWTVFKQGGISLNNITDGTSNTLAFAQRYQMCSDQPTAWAYPRLHYWAPQFAFYSRARFQLAPSAGQCDPGLPQSLGRDGILVALCDGSVRVVADHCSPQTWWYATEPNDGQVLNLDE